MLTLNEVQSQKERFEAFMNSADLAKIGKTWLRMPSSEENGRYTQLCYIHRVLRMTANVGAAYYMPGSNQFYSQILTTKALDAFLSSLQS